MGKKAVACVKDKDEDQSGDQESGELDDGADLSCVRKRKLVKARIEKSRTIRRVILSAAPGAEDYCYRRSLTEQAVILRCRTTEKLRSDRSVQ